MIAVLLTKIKTRDGLALEGIYIKPKQKSKTALIWLHGLSSRFSSGQTLIKELSERCQRAGIGYFKFSNRGHGIVTRGNKKLLGGGFEKFTDCVLDIRAMIRFAKGLGYKKFTLAGHSTGANKALYYIYKTRDRAVKKLILLGPINDIAGEAKMTGLKFLQSGVRIAEKIKKKNPHAVYSNKMYVWQTLMPEKFGIYTAERYLSLYKPGSAEDVFPYYNPRANWKELKGIKIPVAVIVGGQDEYLDRPAKNLIDIFRQKSTGTKSFSGIIIKGANHGFQKKEKELTQEIIKFIKNGL